MSEWLIRVSGIILITACAELILPIGKIKNSCKTVLALACIAVFIQPISDIVGASYDFSGVFDGVEVDSEYVSDTAEYFNSIIEDEVENMLKDKNYVVNDCFVEGFIENGEFNLKKLNVKLDFSVISEKDEHIIVNEVSQLLASYLNVSPEKVGVYGE